MTMELAKRSINIARRFGDRAIGVARLPRLWLYLLSNRRPWRIGYAEYKERYLARVLEDADLREAFREGGPLPARYGYRLDARVVEIPWALARLGTGRTAVLDAGSSLNHGFVLSSSPLPEKQLSILTLAPEIRCYWYRGVSYVFGDIRRTVFRDDCFDEIVCISTIEHVGMANVLYATGPAAEASGSPEDYLAGVRELHRILAPGGRLLISFPFGEYEDHGWFQQMDAQRMDAIVKAFQPTEASERIFKYEPSGWQISSREESGACQFFDVRTSRFFDRSSTIDFPPDFPAGERAVACLELRKGGGS